MSIEGQVGGPRRLIGIEVVGNPSASTPNLQFDAVNNRFIWVAAVAGQTFARVVKKIDEIVNNSIVLQDDDELFAVLNTNKNYGFLEVLFIFSTAVADFQYDHTIPAGAAGARISGPWDPVVPTTSLSVTARIVVATSGSEQVVVLAGRVEMGATPGNFQLRFAQDVAEATNTILRRGSYLILWEETA